MRRLPPQLMSQQLGLNFPVRGGPTRLPPNMMGSPIRELPRTGFPLGMPSQQQLQAMQQQAMQQGIASLGNFAQQQPQYAQQIPQGQPFQAGGRQVSLQEMQQAMQQAMQQPQQYGQQQQQQGQQNTAQLNFHHLYQRLHGQQQQQGQQGQQNTAQPQPSSGYGNYGMR